MRAGDGFDVICNDMEIVSALRAALAERVGRQRFELWFGPSTRLDLDGRRLTVGVPNQFFLDWIRSNFRRHIEGACFELLGGPAEIQFNIDATLPDPRANSPRPEPANSAAADSRPADSRPADSRPADSRPAKGVVSAAQSPNGPSPNGPSRRRFAGLESFVEGRSNRLALASAEMVVRRPGQITPLMVHGHTGVGKTHLLEGIWSGVRRDRRITAVYLSAEQFTTYFLEALRGSGLPNFRRKHRGVGLLVIDDLQFFAGKRATQVELLHTVDALLRQGRQLVFAADRSPDELARSAELGPELATRLQGGMVCRIDPPEYPTRLAIVARMARRMQVDLPPEVQSFVASRLTNHVRELSGALCRLKATGEALRRPITLPLAEEALAEMISHSGRAVWLPDIEKAVCDVFGLQPTSLQSGSKGKRISHPRMLAMWLARKHTRAALSEIGHYFGRRSHSTVVSAQKRVAGWMADGRSLPLAHGDCDVDEAIRQVELQLRAAG